MGERSGHRAVSRTRWAWSACTLLSFGACWSPGGHRGASRRRKVRPYATARALLIRWPSANCPRRGSTSGLFKILNQRVSMPTDVVTHDQNNYDTHILLREGNPHEE